MNDKEYLEARADGFMDAVHQVELGVHLLNKAVSRTWTDLCVVWANSEDADKIRPTIVDAWNATPETDRPEVA